MEFFEFAELFVNREIVQSTEGPVPMFTFQLLVFPQRGKEQTAPELLPKVHVSVHQAPELMRVLQQSLLKYLPEAGEQSSEPGSGGRSPRDLN